MDIKTENEAREQVIAELTAQRAAEIEAMRDRKAKLVEQEETCGPEIKMMQTNKDPEPGRLFRTKQDVSSWLLKSGLKPSSEEYRALYRKHSKDLPIA
jgi:hypothetical protein